MTEKKAEYVYPEDKKPQFGTNWMDIILDERQQNEVHFNKIYADKFNHGTDGHNPRILIAILAKAIDLLISPENIEILVNRRNLDLCFEYSNRKTPDKSCTCSLLITCDCPDCQQPDKAWQEHKK